MFFIYLGGFMKKFMLISLFAMMGIGSQVEAMLFPGPPAYEHFKRIVDANNYVASGSAQGLPSRNESSDDQAQQNIPPVVDESRSNVSPENDEYPYSEEIAPESVYDEITWTLWDDGLPKFGSWAWSWVHPDTKKLCNSLLEKVSSFGAKQDDVSELNQQSEKKLDDQFSGAPDDAGSNNPIVHRNSVSVATSTDLPFEEPKKEQSDCSVQTDNLNPDDNKHAIIGATVTAVVVAAAMYSVYWLYKKYQAPKSPLPLA